MRIVSFEFIGADVAVAHAFVTYKGVSAEGKALRAMDNRLTWVFRRAGDDWKIVHEPTSAPVDFATMNVMLNR
ncbi:MAG: nuclear transport factor 2 family protein [Betaproteobacteria bacterium]